MSHPGQDESGSAPSEWIAAAREWVLVDGNRLVVATGFLLALVAVLAVPGAWAAPTIGTPTPMIELFGAFVAGNFTLLTVVLSINQLVLSRELRSPSELREEVDAATAYRNEVQEETGRRVTPENPSHFLHLLLWSTRHHADALDEHVGAVDDPVLREDIDELVDSLRAQIEDMDDLLEEPGVGLFPALATILSPDFAAEINRTHWLQNAHEEDLPDEILDALAAIQTRLEQFDVARQYVRTLYIQGELAYLSRVLLYVGLPTEAISVLLLLVFTVFPDATLPFATLPVAIAVGFAPLAVLFAYVLRVATVAQRTAAIAPFASPK